MKYDRHDDSVMRVVNRHIATINAKYSGASVALRLEGAWSANIAEREQNASTSKSPIGRDADYYLAARKEVAAVDNPVGKAAIGAIGLAAWPAYSFIKVISMVSEKLGTGPIMRSNPDLPNAPIGGIRWMIRGIVDGCKDDGKVVGPAPLHVIE